MGYLTYDCLEIVFIINSTCKSNVVYPHTDRDRHIQTQIQRYTQTQTHTTILIYYVVDDFDKIHNAFPESRNPIDVDRIGNILF